MTAQPNGGGSMARYYFSIHNGRPFEDIDGLELSDMAEVRVEAIGFALGVGGLARSSSRTWRIRASE